jgi:hypothetical protein
MQLNQAQTTILELFQHRKMTPNELADLKDVLVRHLSGQLDEEVNTVLKRKGLTPTEMVKQTRFTNRTKHLAQIRRVRK